MIIENIHSEDRNINRFTLACVGDSLTFGNALLDNATQSYPSLLKQLLPEDWTVTNHGINGACASPDDENFYLNTPWTNILDEAPDMILLMLGSNDSKDSIWKGKEAFLQGYNQIIQGLSRKGARIILVGPPPCGLNLFGIKNDRLQNEIYPLLREFAAEKGLLFLDMSESLKKESAVYLDNIHLNRKGYKVFSSYLFQKMKETGLF